MHLLVIRHGVAEERSIREDDATRRLTRSGERKVRGVARGLRKLGWKVDRVLTSPWLRAARTAELMKPVCKQPPVETPLLCRAPTSDLLVQISESASSKPNHATAVVGHEPWLGELVSWLAFGDSRHHEGLALKKGGVVWLEGSTIPGGMTLRAVLPPDVTRSLK